MPIPRSNLIHPIDRAIVEHLTPPHASGTSASIALHIMRTGATQARVETTNRMVRGRLEALRRMGIVEIRPDEGSFVNKYQLTHLARKE